MDKGRLHLIPNLLSDVEPESSFPPQVKKLALELKYYVVENVKFSRRLLKKLDRSVDIDSMDIQELPRKNEVVDLSNLLAPALIGHDIGLMTDAGCPAVADPGSQVVRLAHEKGIRVIPHTGPSSILLTVMASGMNGQAFTFNGYLPKDRKDRMVALRKFEDLATKKGITQIFMDTPYRNDNVIEDILNVCRADTRLCIASDITGDHEDIRSMSITYWKKKKKSYQKIPVMFALGS
jgi:16S rRNA (cytidine1402-2'-O)-methyltransferase